MGKLLLLKGVTSGELQEMFKERKKKIQELEEECREILKEFIAMTSTANESKETP